MINEFSKVDVKLRLDNEEVESGFQISTPEKALDFMADVMKELDRENVCVVNLDGSNKPLNYTICSIGDMKSSIANTSNILKAAMLSNASKIILLHNHPSGSIVPSMEDYKVTQKLMYASNIMDIELLDHIVVGGQNGKMCSLRAKAPELFDSSTYLKDIESGFQTKVSENEFLYRSTDKLSKRFAIYQINEEVCGRGFIFEGYYSLQRENKEVYPLNYNFIYAGERSLTTTLDDLYEEFNLNYPNDYRGHSLSVSDIIVMQSDNELSAYFVDTFGFKKLDGFISERKDFCNFLSQDGNLSKHRYKNVESEQELWKKLENFCEEKNKAINSIENISMSLKKHR